MKIINIEPRSDDIVFEFLCLDCGYAVTMPLFEVLSSGNIDVTHVKNEDEEQPLTVVFHKRSSNTTDLPGEFDDFMSEHGIDL